jgi:hypothetical protein
MLLRKSQERERDREREIERERESENLGETRNAAPLEPSAHRGAVRSMNGLGRGCKAAYNLRTKIRSFNIFWTGHSWRRH